MTALTHQKPSTRLKTAPTRPLPFPTYLDIVGIDVVWARHALIYVSECHPCGIDCRRREARMNTGGSHTHRSTHGLCCRAARSQQLPARAPTRLLLWSHTGNHCKKRVENALLMTLSSSPHYLVHSSAARLVAWMDIRDRECCRLTRAQVFQYFLWKLWLLVTFELHLSSEAYLDSQHTDRRAIYQLFLTQKGRTRLERGWRRPTNWAAPLGQCAPLSNSAMITKLCRAK